MNEFWTALDKIGIVLGVGAIAIDFVLWFYLYHISEDVEEIQEDVEDIEEGMSKVKEA